MARKGENIYKRKDGRWEARCIMFYDETGRAHYKSVYAGSYAEVKRKKQNLHFQERSVSNPSARDKELFETVCRQWLNHTKLNIKESSYVKYRSILENHVIPLLGGYCLKKLDAKVLTQYFTELSEHGKADGTGLSAKSIADIRSVVKMALSFAQLEGWIQGFQMNPAAARQESQPVKVLTQREQKLLEQKLLSDRSNVHIGIYICLYTGIRLGELCALHWEAVDLNTKLLTIKQTMLRIKDYSSESGKKTKVIETPPKSACSIRKIPIPDFLLCMLEEKSVGMQGREYLLTGRSDKYIEPRVMEYHFGKITTACGITDANFHCLRHTFATRCVELGFDVKTLSEILGHASISITMNRYVHPSMELKRNQMDKLSSLSGFN